MDHHRDETNATTGEAPEEDGGGRDETAENAFAQAYAYSAYDASAMMMLHERDDDGSTAHQHHHQQQQQHGEKQYGEKQLQRK